MLDVWKEYGFGTILDGYLKIINPDEYLDTYIFSDTTMKENTGSDIVRRLKIAFSDKGYINRIDKSDKRWIDEEINVVTEGILEFVSNIQ